MNDITKKEREIINAWKGGSNITDLQILVGPEDKVQVITTCDDSNDLTIKRENGKFLTVGRLPSITIERKQDEH